MNKKATLSQWKKRKTKYFQTSANICHIGFSWKYCVVLERAATAAANHFEIFDFEPNVCLDNEVIDEVFSCVLFTLWFWSFYLRWRTYTLLPPLPPLPPSPSPLALQAIYPMRCENLRKWDASKSIAWSVCLYGNINHKVHPSNGSNWLKFGFVFFSITAPWKHIKDITFCALCLV